MKPLREHIKENVSLIIQHWFEAVSEEPWVMLPDRDRVDFIPVVIEAIVEGVLGRAPTLGTIQPIADAAREHGEHRAELGIPDSVLFTEYDVLRRAMWRFLVSSGITARTAERAILRIDAAISLATRASVVGFHRAQLESLGKWDDAISKLVEESALGLEARARMDAWEEEEVR